MKLEGFEYAPCARCYRKGALNHVGLCVNCAGIAQHNPTQCPDPASCDRCQSVTVTMLNRRVPVTQHTIDAGSMSVTISADAVEKESKEPETIPHITNTCTRCGRVGTFMIKYMGSTGRMVRAWYCGIHRPWFFR